MTSCTVHSPTNSLAQPACILVYIECNPAPGGSPFELSLGLRSNSQVLLPPSLLRASCVVVCPRFCLGSPHLISMIKIMLYQFQIYLPTDYNLLAKVVECLPGNTVSEVMPFISLVVNINVWTDAHRDKWDKHLCLVLAIGDFSDGGLVLKEQGLVLELRNGNWAVFRSSKSTHFNLDYTGRHATFVMQTDIEFDKWIEGRNGWNHSNLFLWEVLDVRIVS